MSDPIKDAAERLEPYLRAAFLLAIQNVANQADVDAIVAAIQAGDAEGALRALGMGPQATLPEMAAALRSGIEAGALALPATLPASRVEALLVRFDMLNPSTAQFMREYELSLIRQITDKTREGLREVLLDGLQKGQNPRETAVAARENLGLTKRQTQAVANFRKELETFHEKRSAGAWGLGNKINRAPGGSQVWITDKNGNPTDKIDVRRLRDFRFDPTLQNALKSGKPIEPAKIDEMVSRYQARMLKHRAQTIARTESLRAANAGALQRWRDAIEAGKTTAELIRKRWIVARDERTCPICKPIPADNKGVEGYGIQVDLPFKTSAGPFMTAPVHPDCRCTVLFRILEPSMVGQPPT